MEEDLNNGNEDEQKLKRKSSIITEKEPRNKKLKQEIRDEKIIVDEEETQKLLKGFVLNVYKPVSKTPLEMINLLKEKEPKYQIICPNKKKLPVSYAGRLDPMAHGVLILLVGEENKKRNEYEFFEKDYIFQSIYGLLTDTYDILGMLNECDTLLTSPICTQNEFEIQLNTALETFPKGKFYQKYPPYSSKRVDGKFLFDWAKEGKIDEIEIPSKAVEIYEMKVLKIEKIKLSVLFESIKEKIQNITSGEFRQKEILEKWNTLSIQNADVEFFSTTIEAKVSHGTYVRSISHELGKMISKGAVVVDLQRTRVGAFKIEDSIII